MTFKNFLFTYKRNECYISEQAFGLQWVNSCGIRYEGGNFLKTEYPFLGTGLY